jgi:conjugal transfer mating pair stabilization protein TraN
MDFTEIYSEFVDAAKLPDEAAALIEIQAKIEAYYAAHKP